MTRSVEALVERLGYPAAPPDPRFREALTHASAALTPNYERLEFYGDAVLKLVVSKWLYERFPRMREGEMTQVRASVVSDETLARVAKDMELGAHLILGAAEKRGNGREKVGIIASSFEALLGAVHLSMGDQAAEQFLVRWLGPEFEKALVVGGSQNHKAVLQEWAQGNKQPLPAYELLASEGPDHARQFVIEVSLAGKPLGRGTGPSKKVAEQRAAEAALASVLPNRRTRSR